MLRLKKNIHSLTSAETPSTMTDSQRKAVGSGCRILRTEPVSSSQPTSRMAKETIMDATYSMRACPKGCSRSAGRAAMRKETSEMICEPASDRLFTASACTDRAPLRTPTMNFPAASSRFSAMPTAPAMVPYARRPVGVDGSRPRRNRRQRRVVMVSYNLRGRRRRHYLSPQYFLSRLLSWIASAMCCSSIRSEPSRSATVRATRMTRS